MDNVIDMTPATVVEVVANWHKNWLAYQKLDRKYFEALKLLTDAGADVSVEAVSNVRDLRTASEAAKKAWAFANDQLHYFGEQLTGIKTEWWLDDKNSE